MSRTRKKVDKRPDREWRGAPAEEHVRPRGRQGQGPGACARREESLARDSRFPLSPAGPGTALQVVILHHMLSKASVRARPSVLWCYKKELGFSRSALATPAGRMYLAHA